MASAAQSAVVLNDSRAVYDAKIAQHGIGIYDRAGHYKYAHANARAWGQPRAWVHGRDQREARSFNYNPDLVPHSVRTKRHECQ
jgi:nitrate reductase cytochrome c-type subunit